MEFIKFLGRAALNGKQIAIYRDDDEIVVKAETIGFKPVRFQAVVDGETAWRACQELRMSDEQYDEWEDRVISGLTPGDARIVQRALIECGYPAELFE